MQLEKFNNLENFCNTFGAESFFCCFLTLIAGVYKKQPPEVFFRKGALKIRSKFIGKQSCKSVISIKLLCNTIEIALRRRCSLILLELWFEVGSKVLQVLVFF